MPCSRTSTAFSGFSVNDIEAARLFYGEKLGLTVAMNEMGILDITLANGARLIAYPKDNHEPATFTILNFVVADIEAAIDQLAAAGVQMEHYPPSEYMKQDAKGIARDPNGPADCLVHGSGWQRSLCHSGFAV